jgi:Zn-dependent peptidase ImmA (M78 family)
MHPKLIVHASARPFLSYEDIEKKAEEVLRFLQPRALEEPTATHVCQIAKLFEDRKWVSVRTDAHLGESYEGHRILGKYSFGERTIYIDRSLSLESPQGRFTLGHELSHFILHRKVSLEARVLADAEVSLQLLEERGWSDLEWLEWQANSLSSCLLMPRSTVGTALAAHQRDQGILKNLGHIFLTGPTGKHDLDYRNALSFLEKKFATPRPIVAYRLRKLNLIDDRRVQDTARPLTAVFPTAFWQD